MKASLFLFLFLIANFADADVRPAAECEFTPTPFVRNMTRANASERRSTYNQATCFGQRFPNFCSPRTIGNRPHIRSGTSYGNPFRCYLAHGREEWRIRSCLSQELALGPFNQRIPQGELRDRVSEMLAPRNCPRFQEAEPSFVARQTAVDTRSAIQQLIDPRPVPRIQPTRMPTALDRIEGTNNSWSQSFMRTFSERTECVGRTLGENCRPMPNRQGRPRCYDGYKKELLEVFDELTDSDAQGNPRYSGMPNMLLDISMRTGGRIPLDELQRWYRTYRTQHIDVSDMARGNSASSAHTSGLLRDMGMVNLLDPARIPGTSEVITARGAANDFPRMGTPTRVGGETRYHCEQTAEERTLTLELQALRIPGASYVYTGGRRGHGHIETRGANGGYFSDFQSGGMRGRCLVGIYIPQGQLEALCQQ